MVVYVPVDADDIALWDAGGVVDAADRETWSVTTQFVENSTAPGPDREDDAGYQLMVKAIGEHQWPAVASIEVSSDRVDVLDEASGQVSVCSSIARVDVLSVHIVDEDNDLAWYDVSELSDVRRCLSS